MKTNHTKDKETCQCTDFNKDIIDTSECKLHQGNPNTPEVDAGIEEVQDTVEYWVDQASKGANIAECWQNIHRIHHQQLQKARHDWLREEIVRLERMKDKYSFNNGVSADMFVTAKNTAYQTIIDRYQAKLNQDATSNLEK